MAAKTQRQATILRLVRTHRVTSQDVLRQLLADEGIDVAQGTLSRDVRELGLVKVHDGDQGAAYTIPPDAADPAPSLSRLLPPLYVGLDGVDNMIVLHTVTGGAQPVAVALDHEEWDEVLGTIAGDDTILIILRNRKHRQPVARRLRTLAGLSPDDQS